MKSFLALKSILENFEIQNIVGHSILSPYNGSIDRKALTRLEIQKLRNPYPNVKVTDEALSNPRNEEKDPEYSLWSGTSSKSLIPSPSFFDA